RFGAPAHVDCSIVIILGLILFQCSYPFLGFCKIPAVIV
uniref:Uncharacterized protein n=1 Tax=Aegilops tauschii subsp. strangulata TaxID=200361 RepID=A0A453H8D4_AEGTS